MFGLATVRRAINFLKVKFAGIENHPSETNSRVLIFTGAGISAESGVQTFRGEKGLWNGRNVAEVCSSYGFLKDPDNVNSFFDELRANLEDKLPNEAHLTIAKLSKKYPGRIDVITQNIDDLFEKAGCDNVIHLHGTLTDLRCVECEAIFRVGYLSQKEAGCCPSCGGNLLRHNVVMFGEEAPNYSILNDSILNCQLLVVIGTSGNVIDISEVTEFFEFSILCNLDPDPLFDYHFTEVYHMPATEAIRILENRIVEFLGGICFLNENDHEVFMRILTNPPKATRELKKLMATESLDVR